MFMCAEWIKRMRRISTIGCFWLAAMVFSLLLTTRFVRIETNFDLLVLLKQSQQKKTGLVMHNSRSIYNSRIAWLLGMSALDKSNKLSESQALKYWRKYPVWTATMLQSLASEAGRQNQLDDAVLYADLSLALLPSSNAVSKIVAKYLTEHERWEQAVRFWKIAEADNVDDAEIQTWLGYALFRQGSATEARWHLEKAIVLSPDAWPTNNNYVRFLKEYGPLEEYKAQLSRCHALFPETMIYVQWLGELALQEGEFEQAERYLLKVFEERPSWVQTVNSLEQLYMLTKQPEKVVWIYRTATKMVPTEAKYHTGLIRALQVLGDVDSVQQHLCQLETQDPDLFMKVLSQADIDTSVCATNK